jgi:hypothetical protein
MTEEFLLKEYELCFEQLRFYDKREESILKYTFSIVSVVGTALFAVYKYLEEKRVPFPFGALAALSVLLFFITLLLFLAAVSNRYYFVTSARQVNAIRKYYLEKEKNPEGFGTEKNRMWTDPKWKFLNYRSLHTYILLGVAVLSSVFAGVFAYAIGAASGCPWGYAAVAFLVALGAEVALGIWGLSERPAQNRS